MIPFESMACPRIPRTVEQCLRGRELSHLASYP
jgi:hypothetical protein